MGYHSILGVVHSISYSSIQEFCYEFEYVFFSHTHAYGFKWVSVILFSMQC